MSEKTFCKLATREDGEQVVALLSEDDEGHAAVLFMLKADGLCVDIFVPFPDADQSVAWKKAQNMFDGLDDDAMFKVRSDVQKDLAMN